MQPASKAVAHASSAEDSARASVEAIKGALVGRQSSFNSLSLENREESKRLVSAAGDSQIERVEVKPLERALELAEKEKDYAELILSKTSISDADGGERLTCGHSVLAHHFCNIRKHLSRFINWKSKLGSWKCKSI